MHIRPVDMPALRDDAVRHVGKHGETFFRGESRSTFAGASPRDLADAEIRRLGQAELFHISRDMTDLARTAGEDMPGFSLQKEDLPAHTGFVFFDTPVGVVDAPGEADYVAASWGPCEAYRDDGSGLVDAGVWIVWYFDVQGSKEVLIPKEGVTIGDAMGGKLCIDLEMVVPMVDEFEYEHVDGDHDPAVEPILFRTLKTVWVLMGQSVAAESAAHYDRATRRRLARDGKEPEPVRVITLRRPRSSEAASESDREYHHRWIVRGHWRQQWYPSRGVNRPVWIAPHVKGPDDAPLLGGAKVYALKR